MPKGEWTSPWTMSFADNAGKTVIVEIQFDVPTLVINGAGLVGYRQFGCLYDRVVVGRVEDGTRRVWLIPEGSFDVPPAVLAAEGFTLITDVTESGFTLGTSETPT